MPNRILKENIRTSKKVNAVSDFEFRLWAYLITYVDDYGRGSADTAILKGFAFPLRKSVTEKNIGDALKRLACVGLIHLYEVDGEPYLYFPNWSNHQRIQTKHSKFPEPPLSTVIHGDPPSESNPIQIESNTNPKENTKEKPIAKMVEEYTDDPVLKSALQDFVAMRRSMKGFTPRAMQMCLNELKKLSGGDRSTSIKIVNQSVKNGWKGFYALKKEQVIPEYKSEEITEEEATAEQIEAVNKLKESLNVQP